MMRQPKAMTTDLKTLLERPALRLTDAALDGVYLASSMSTYAANCLSDAQNQLQFHQINDLDLALLEISLFLAYALLARYGQIYKTTAWLAWISCSWPHFRNLISGLKNGRSAVVNTSFLIQHTCHHAIYCVANPVGIIVGGLLAVNLIWYHHMKKARQENINYNLALSEENNDLVKKHSPLQRGVNYLSTVFDGVTDGMYLYGCLFMLIGLGINAISAGTPLILAVVTVSLITLAAVITKVHEEHMAQQAFINSQKKLLIPQKQPHDKELGAAIAALFTVGRAVLSGAKNANAVVNTVKYFSAQFITKLCFVIAAVGLGTLYAIYLGLKAAYHLPPMTAGLFSHTNKKLFNPSCSTKLSYADPLGVN